MTRKILTCLLLPLVWLAGAGLLSGCARHEAPDISHNTEPLAPPQVAPVAGLADEAAWVEQAVPLLLGRPVRSYGELKFLSVAVSRLGRTVVAEAMMRDPAFVERWTGVLLDRMQVDRIGARSQVGCFRAPLLQPLGALDILTRQQAAARHVLHTNRADGVAGEPVAPPPGNLFNMADLVRGAIHGNNLFPAYRGYLFALVNRPDGEDSMETPAMKRRHLGDHFMQVFTNKAVTCMGCHRSYYDATGGRMFLTPQYDWAAGMEAQVLSGVPAWGVAAPMDNPAATDAQWTGSFARSTGATAPFTDWDAGCGSFAADSSAAATGGGLLLADSANPTVWSLDARLKQGYAILRAARDTDLGTGGAVDDGRALGAFWMAAAFANSVWEEVFGTSLTIPNYVSRTPEQQSMLWNLTENHVLRREWSLRGLLLEILTAPNSYFGRVPTSALTMPHVFRPFDPYLLPVPPAVARDSVGDTVHRRSADLLFRMKAAALGWRNPDGSLLVTHFPGAESAPPSQDEASGMGLYLSRFEQASPTISQLSMLAWEASAGRCRQPPGIGADWIDALAARASTSGVSLFETVDALRFRLLGRGLSRALGDTTEVNAVLAFLGGGRTSGMSFAAAYPSGGASALRDLCEVLLKTPHFLMAGIAHGTTNFALTPEPALQVGDVQMGALVDDTPQAACLSWSAQFGTTGIDCSDVNFFTPPDWELICPRGRCYFRDDIRFPPWEPWPCLSCPFEFNWESLRPPPVDPRKEFALPGQKPARTGLFLAWAEGAQINALGGTVRIVRRDGKLETASLGKLLNLGDSLELWAGASFTVTAPDGKIFQSPPGGMPTTAVSGTWLFMATGPAGLPAPTQFVAPPVSRTTALAAAAAALRQARSDEPGAVAFQHTVTAPVGNVSYLDHPALNSYPDRVVLVSASAAGTTNNRAVGVWYNAGAKRWAIYNESGAAMPAGAQFTIRAMAPSPRAYVHLTSAANRSGHVTYLDSPALNGRPYAAVQISHVYNPPGASGIYNDHPVGVYYDGGSGRWAIYNEDFAAMPLGAGFAIKQGGAFTVTSSAATRVGNAVVISDPGINGVPGARLFLTHNWNPPGSAGTYHNRQSALRYDAGLGKWTLVNLDGTAVANGVAMNIHRGD